MSLPKILLLLSIFCIFYANSVSIISEPDPIFQPFLSRAIRDAEEEATEWDYNYPCMRDGVEMRKPTGELTRTSNYWLGKIDLREYSYLKTIKLVIRVDQPAKIVVDPKDGKTNGAKTGKVFRVIYNGTPEEVPEVHFKIIGTSGILFPNLVSIHLNNRDICKGALTCLMNVAEKAEEHFNMAGMALSGVGNMLKGLFSSYKDASTTTPKPKTTKTTKSKAMTAAWGSTTTTTTTVAPSTCGKRQVKQSAYITNGWEVRPGDYPWHAALFHKGSRSSSYKCGGTLINKQTVITAAHCLYSNGRAIVPEKVSIQLGKHNLNIFDSNTVEYQVFKLIIHPEYSSIDLQDDIALVRLDNVVEFTQFIFPACLWKADKKSLDNVIGRKGSVVGWGLTEDDGLAEVLNAGTMPVVGFLECLESDRDFFGPFLSDFNYCAGYRNGTSVCNGDSGGGMFFQENGLWTLRGLVSFSSVREDRDICNPQNFVIFTDVAKYLDWIGENM